MTDPTNSPTQPSRKRRRPAVVCAECRRRKIACDRKSPCGQCALHNVECIYVTGSVAPAYGRPLRPQLATGGRHSGGDSAAGAAMGTSATDQGAAQDSAAAAPAASGSPLDDDDEVNSAAEADQRHPIVSLGERSSRFGGRLAKTRLFGRSHWMNNMDEFKDVHSLTHLVHFVSGSVIYKSMRISKRIARIIKAEEMRRVATRPHSPDSPAGEAPQPDVDTWFNVPPRAVADRLVDLYINVFESQFRILHIPTFRREYAAYMDGPRRRRGTQTAAGAAQTNKAREKTDRESKAATIAHQVFMVKLVLVLALGSCFYDDVDDPAAAAAMHDDLRIAAARMVTQQKNIADFAYCVPLDKHRLNLDTLQTYCLVTVARQTVALALGDDMTWFTTGGLLHTVFGMGLNRDPSHFKSLSFAQAEMRRRLWATILELVVQSSLDQGMPPLISTDDYDCAAPLNLNDDDFGVDGDNNDGDDAAHSQQSHNPLDVEIPVHLHPKEKGDTAQPARAHSVPQAPAHSTTASKGHPDTVFTQTSMQRLLYRSLPTRLKIVKALNGLGASLTYERALQLSQELLETCRYAAPALHAAPLNSSIGSSSSRSSTARPIPEAERAAFAKMRIAFYEMLTRRFHHSLHSPFARKAGNNVQFYFSRRTRVETVLRLLSFFRPAPGGLADFNAPLSSDAPALSSGVPMSLVRPTAVEDPCRRLWLIGRGLLKCTMVDIKATAVIEMIHQLQEEHFVPGSDLTLSQRELYDIVQMIVELSHARMEAGGTNVKSYLFFRAALAQVDALMSGKPVRQTIVDAAQKASEQAMSTLKGLAARRGVALPDDIDDDDGGDGDGGGNDDTGDAATISPAVLQADGLRVDGPSGTGMSGPVPQLATGSSFSSVVGGSNDVSTPSQILGMVDVDAGVHLASGGPSSGTSGGDSAPGMGMGMSMSMGMSMGGIGHGQGWVDDWVVGNEFGMDNWFFPYNDRIDNS